MLDEAARTLNTAVLDAPAARALGRRGWQAAAVALGLAGSLLVAVTAQAVGPLPDVRPQPWWFALPAEWITAPDGVRVLTALFYAGLGVLTVAWLGVGLGVRAGIWRVRALWLLATLWALPWLLGPVALSTDVYTYLGQGFVGHAGLDTYTNGPASVPLPPDLLAHMSSVWLHTPSPYGPLFIGLASLIAPLTTNNVILAVILLRLIEVAGLALAAVSVPRIARAAGVSPALATWLGVASPLVLASCVLSGHNDGLMAGFLLAGVALAVSGRPVLAIAVCTVAALVKAPAAVGVGLLALAWVRRGSGWREIGGRLAGASAVIAAVAAAVSVATGVGANWLNLAAVASPTASATPITPSASLAIAFTTIGRALGAPVDADIALAATRLLGAVVAAIVALVVLWREPRIGLARGLGVALLVVVLAGPVTWPWYLCWPLLLLAGAVSGRARVALIALTAVAPFLIDPNGLSQPIGTFGSVLIAAASIGLLALLARWVRQQAGSEPFAVPGAFAVK